MDAARKIIESAGFTFCEHSSFETDTTLHGFSVESAGGFSASGPAAWVNIDKDTGEVFLNNHKVEV